MATATVAEARMILIDLNVILDVVQRREPHFRTSSAVLEAVIDGRDQGAIPAHAVTTLHYIVDRYQDRTTANGAVGWLLRHFEVAGVGKSELAAALAAPMDDYEDAVMAEAAVSAGCEAIVTRNVKDFSRAPLRSLTPEEFLLELEA